MDRRKFLAALSAGVSVLAVPSFAQSPLANPYKRLLILVELKGANDGLNTFIPYADDAYYALRPTIGIKRDQVLQLSDKFGLHPALDADGRAQRVVRVVGVRNEGVQAIVRAFQLDQDEQAFVRVG